MLQWRSFYNDQTQKLNDLKNKSNITLKEKSQLELFEQQVKQGTIYTGNFEVIKTKQDTDLVQEFIYWVRRQPYFTHRSGESQILVYFHNLKYDA